MFVLSAALAGLAGSMKTLVLGFASLSDVHWQTSGEVILMTLLGGLGTFLGPVVGAGVVIALQDTLADRVGSWVTVIIGGDLRRLRAAVPARHRRRIRGVAGAPTGTGGEVSVHIEAPRRLFHVERPRPRDRLE